MAVINLGRKRVENGINNRLSQTAGFEGLVKLQEGKYGVLADDTNNHDNSGVDAHIQIITVKD